MRHVITSAPRPELARADLGAVLRVADVRDCVQPRRPPLELAHPVRVRRERHDDQHGLGRAVRQLELAHERDRLQRLTEALRA